uniref:Retrotransposon protein, putative, unclassified n=1 Tax=Oryza sativa subsp. japonica TaxID=39947 RepID=Q2QR44_ORYSJ|nr:retrotransposon protein, putative, unclassified [Oryza sativa Japonica Group]
MAQDAGDTVLPASRIMADRHLSLPRKIMPEGAVVRAGELRPRPLYPERSVHLLSFAMAGLIPPFSGFFHEVLDFYEIHALHLAPNAVMTLAIFAHLCEMFIGVRLTMRLFQSFFIPQLLQGAVVGGCYFQPRPGTAGQYIESHLRKKWEDWKKDWFYTVLPDHPRLRLPAEYDAVWDRLRGLRSLGLTGAMVFGDYFRRRIAPLQDRSRGAWEYTGPNNPMRTHVGERWDWEEEDAKMVIRRVLGLDSAEQTLIPDGILSLWCDRDRESILAVSVVGTGRSRSSRDGTGGSAADVAGGGATAGGSRTSGPGGGGSSRSPGPNRGPGDDSASDPKGKRKMSESRPPSPPRGGGAERVDRPLAGHKSPAGTEAGRKKKRLRKIGQMEPCRGSFIEPPKWTFNRPPRRLGRSKAAGPSQPLGRAHGPHTGSGPERTPAGTRPAAGDSGGDVPPGGDSETRVHAERHPGSGGEGGRGSDAEAGGGLELEVKAEIGGGPEPEAESEIGGGPKPEAEAESTRGPEAGGERDGRSPLHLGRPQGWSCRRGAESIPQSRGGSSGTPSSRGRAATFSSPTPARAQRPSSSPGGRASGPGGCMGTARVRVDEGRRAVDDMVRVGRKMRQAQLAKIQAREESLDSVMREVEEERQAALIASSVLDEALGDIAFSTRPMPRIWRRGSRTPAVSSTQLLPKSSGYRRPMPRCGLGQRRSRPNAGPWMSVSAPRRSSRPRFAGESRSSIRASRTAAEVEASLHLREEAAAERDRITLAAKASVDRHAEELRLWEEACRERDVVLAEREAEVNRHEVASRRLGEQLAKREEAVAGRDARHLESARAERAAIAARASELEAREKDLAAGGQPGGAELGSQLAMAQSTLADIERLVQDQAREIAALRLTNGIGPGKLSDAVDRLERAGRRVGISVHRDRTEARAREQVREAADAIVSNFEGSAPRFTFGLASDKESGSGDDDDDFGGEDWDDVCHAQKFNPNFRTILCIKSLSRTSQGTQNDK